jgi:Cytochrome c biogenesis factor
MALFLLCAVPAAQIDPRSALIERAAWTALNAGQAHAAAEGFREALEADPKNPGLHLGAGMAASLERRDADARSEFERALALDPKLTPARAMLGQIQYRLGERELAVRTYETLVAMAPDDADARATLERWRREADLHHRMEQAVGSHFTVSFEGPAEAEVAARRSTSSIARTGASASCWAATRRRQSASCSTRTSSSATSHARPRGPRAPTTASSVCRCAARSTIGKSSIECCRTSSPTR